MDTPKTPAPEIPPEVPAAPPAPPYDPKLAREFPYMRPRRWLQKKSKKYFKVLPWFQPLDNESRLDFKALFRDLVPELGFDKAMGKMEIYSGLVMHCGYQIYNDGGMWFCIEHHGKQFFKDCGLWDEEKHGKSIPMRPVTKDGEVRKKKDRAERTAATRKKNRNKK